MRLTIFGATGKTGRLLLALALQQSHECCVLVRDAAKLPPLSGPVRVVAGDVRDPGPVTEAVTGAEAVLSVLGPASNAPRLAVSQGMDNILAAMPAHGVRRLVVSVGAGVRDPEDRPTPAHIFFGALVRLLSQGAYADMLSVSTKVRASGLDSTIVRVPRLTDGPPTGQVRVGLVGKAVGLKLSRADMADFMLRQASDTTHVCRAPAISN
jgi:nucleoside-diphosphate-sugar epimerase